MIMAAALFLAAAVPAQADPLLKGTVQAIDPQRIVVDGVAHRLDSTTTFEVMPQGGRLDPAQIVPGTTVYLEIGDNGRVTAVRALVAR
jgi:acetamidase/formamidase